MGRLFIEDTTLASIGTAIREKTGKSELINPVDMPDEIRNISGGGGEVFNEISYNQEAYQAYDATPFVYNYFNNFIDGKSFTINTLKSLGVMFYKSDELVDLSKIVINFTGNSMRYVNEMFFGCNKLEQLPTLNIVNEVKKGVYYLYSIFGSCHRLRYIDENLWQNIISLIDKDTSYSYRISGFFSYCYSLRQLPDLSIFNEIKNSNTNQYRYLLYQLIHKCYVLDTAENIPLENSTITKDMLSQTFNDCCRVKDIIFATDNGTPYVRTWSNQTIDLSSNIGYAYSTDYILGYNSGITADKQVSDDATYQALKDDPDWFSIDVAYSRYNHTSAVRTINSLPDCSTGSGNTIKFLGASGSATDGGAISNLTEAEIAVATAKGWTVEIV